MNIHKEGCDSWTVNSTGTKSLIILIICGKNYDSEEGAMFTKIYF